MKGVVDKEEHGIIVPLATIGSFVTREEYRRVHDDVFPILISDLVEMKTMDVKSLVRQGVIDPEPMGKEARAEVESLNQKTGISIKIAFGVTGKIVISD